MSKTDNKTETQTVATTTNRKVGLAKKTMRKLNEGELSQVAGGLFGSSDPGCARCSTSGYYINTCSVY